MTFEFVEKREVDKIIPKDDTIRQQVNNPIMLSFTQFGSNNIQIFSVQNYRKNNNNKEE